jgi:asparagine synthase (glutamine-hydrolysing)
MCGIFALIGDTESPENYFITGSKRGPEFSKLIKYGSDIHIGFHRLAINGLNDESNQPMEYGNCILICNGEIFNYKELITKYNLTIYTESDCEVIPALYEKLGYNFIHELDGEFSFILFDKLNGHIIIARDPYGVRPLYMNTYNGKYCFASDLEPMKCLPLHNIQHFKPGTMMIIDMVNYYNKSIINYYNVKDKFVENYEEDFYNLFCNAVKKRVITCERPIACLLSGGLDSSLVAALSARYCKEKGIVLETYSIGLPESEDLKYAAKVAKHIGSKHTEIIFTEEDFYNSIPDVIKDIESYDTTSVRASVGNWNVGKYIKEHSEARVILNGDGADELMGGYMYFHACPNSTEFNNECRRLLENIHCFDVLRSDKSISSHGLEPRTPFLDLALVEYYLNIPSNIRDHNIQKKQEKYFIRHVINKFDSDLLPREVLYRKKEAFSDGVSGLNRSWYEIIQEKVANEIIDDMLYIYNPPITKEQKYYRNIYEKQYPLCAHLTPYFWMPRYVNATDASARTLSLYNTACE